MWMYDSVHSRPLSVRSPSAAAVSPSWSYKSFCAVLPCYSFTLFLFMPAAVCCIVVQCYCSPVVLWRQSRVPKRDLQVIYSGVLLFSRPKNEKVKLYLNGFIYCLRSRSPGKVIKSGAIFLMFIKIPAERRYNNCKFSESKKCTRVVRIELAATRSTSFCGLAKSSDSYQWHEMSDRKINILLSSKVTSALKMSWLRGLAPAVIYLDMKSARMNTIGLTVSSTQEIAGKFFLSPLMNCSLSWLPFAVRLWM